MKIVVLDKISRTSVKLPDKVRGQYSIRRKDNTDLIKIDAVDGRWVAKSNSYASLEENGKLVPECSLQRNFIYYIQLTETKERIPFFVESRLGQCQKYQIPEEGKIIISNRKDAHICYNNRKLNIPINIIINYQKDHFVVENLEADKNLNGNRIYMNHKFLNKAYAKYGDCIYIFGLKLILGRGFVIVNKLEDLISINLKIFQLRSSKQQSFHESKPRQLPFSTAPGGKYPIVEEKINIEAPPALMLTEETPIALMIGPSVTMSLASVLTSCFSIMSAIENGSDLSAVYPSIIMASTMIMGSVMWPLLSRGYEKRKRRRKDEENYSIYQEYLEEIKEKINTMRLEQSRKLRMQFPNLIDCENRITGRESSLWQRSLDEKNFMEVAIGRADLPIRCELVYPNTDLFGQQYDAKKLLEDFKQMDKMMKQVPLSYSFAESKLTGIVGERKFVKQLVMGILLQMVALHNYNELKIGVIYNEAEQDWEVLKWIPHNWSDDKKMRYLVHTNKDLESFSKYLEFIRTMRSEYSKEEMQYESPHYLLILADQKLAERSETIKTLYNIRTNIKLSMILLYNEKKYLPKNCTHIIYASEKEVHFSNYEDEKQADLCADTSYYYINDPQRFCTTLADIPLDVVAEKAMLPEQFTLFELLSIGKPEHCDFRMLWEENDPTKSLAVPIGIDGDRNLIYLDIHEKAHGPHGLIAGMTGSGKSEFIISYIMMLALNFKPTELAFILIDFKGGGMANTFQKLPHITGTITNLDGKELKRSLMAIESELERRQKQFKEVSEQQKISNVDIYRYQSLYREGKIQYAMPHLVIISDEFAELKQQQPEFMDQLIRIARIGRSLGVHMILATQKPDGVVNEQIRSNIKFKICLKVQDKSDSQSMINRPDAAMLTTAGRFYFQVGVNEVFELGQSPWSGATYIESDQAVEQKDESVVVFRGLERIVNRPHPIIVGEARKEIDVLIDYMEKICEEQKIKAKKLWKEQLPIPIYKQETDEEEDKTLISLEPVIGIYDDLRNQEHRVVTFPISKSGNVCLYGAAGSGLLQVLNRTIYELIHKHTKEQLKLYLVDFDSGALKAFEEAPQVKGVYTSHENTEANKIIDFLAEIELEQRKKKISSYGGNYRLYQKNSGQKLESILLIIHNFAVFREISYDVIKAVEKLVREGTAYGIYLILTADSAKGIPMNIRMDFKQVYTLQQNNIDNYMDILGKKPDILPAPYIGRGIFMRDFITYEFQTELLFEDGNAFELIQQDCKRLKQQEMANKVEEVFPTRISKKIKMNLKEKTNRSLEQIPLDYADLNGERIFYDLTRQVIHFIILNPITREKEKQMLLEEIKRTTFKQGKLIFLQKENLEEEINCFIEECKKRYEEGKLIKEREQLNFLPYVYVMDSFYENYSRLPLEYKRKLCGYMTKITIRYHIYFVLIDNKQFLETYTFKTFFKQKESSYGIWMYETKENMDLLYGKELCFLEAETNQKGWVIKEKKAIACYEEEE